MRYRFIINPQYAPLTQFIHELPRRFDTEGTLIYDKRNTVRTFVANGQTVVVKRFHRPMLHQRIDYTFIRPSKARRAYTYALRLLDMGIDTPTPIAYIEEYSCGLFRTGFLVTTFCGDPDARLLREEPEGHDALIEALAKSLVKMHENGFMHGDTNLSNFLYRPDAASPSGFHITTIDVNRSKFIGQPTKEDCLANLMRLTHERPALRKIVGRYAELRGWDADQAYNYVLGRLEAFEKKRALKHKLKGKK